ncbi:cytochrome C biogenesis protein [Pueribacillus theae]|uniref:Cytochrome C biogenesis protein n=1 Tax=Pueribacillus theae TaxID=2171751 RepID=A0A2U1K5N8_9BACI|nr:cytochrome c biogenesis protein ResB [Pueribacillus theae]PWA12514.1 cytochrome C biogenesis protein [Pueribacillus theae]
MKEIICECGHKNPPGTMLCESCGKPLGSEEHSNEILNMRYEGSARRSQTYQRTLIDKVWNFFSSVKVGVWIIVILVIASAIGTLFPQEMYIPPGVSASTYYEEQYGFLGKLYYTLGFHNLYSQWWYILLLSALGTSIIIASLDRFVPLYRSLKNQRVTRHDSFMKRQRIFGVTKTNDPDPIISLAKDELKKKRYKVREENGNLLAEKNRFSRWGAYVNHTGLIIFLIGAMLRFFPGMYVDEMFQLRDGETKAIPGTNGEYYLKNNQFIFEVYDEKDEKFKNAIQSTEQGMVAKNFQTNATLFKREDDAIPGSEPKLMKVKDYPIRVNEPLKVEGYAIYQTSYKLNELQSMSFSLEKKNPEDKIGNFNVDLLKPKEKYDLGNGYTVELMDYFPDFEFNEKGEPTTKSKAPNNPAFIFKMITPEKPEGEVSFVAIRQNLEPLGENMYKLSFSGVETTNTTALTVRKDNTLWILAIGGAIFMIGVVQGMYWHHRRIWIGRKENEVWMAGHTNKGWFGLKNEMEWIAEKIGLEKPIDQVEEKNKAEE